MSDLTEAVDALRLVTNALSKALTHREVKAHEAAEAILAAETILRKHPAKGLSHDRS